MKVSETMRVGGIVLAGASVLLAGCGPRTGPSAGAARHQAPSTSGSAARRHTHPASPHRSTRTPRPSPTHSSATHRRMLRPGAHGAQVLALYHELAAWRYDPGSPQRTYGERLEYAVWAFQKVNGLHPDGVIGPQTRRALAHPRRPSPLVPGGAADRVEIDLTHQLMFVYTGGKLYRILHISSGSGQRFCSQGSCRIAGTPTGDFTTSRRVRGWHHSPLGEMYNPIFFVGGIAMHGEPYTPNFPASHGCVRIPMHSSYWLPRVVGHHEHVYVRRP